MRGGTVEAGAVPRAILLDAVDNALGIGGVRDVGLADPCDPMPLLDFVGISLRDRLAKRRAAAVAPR